MSVVTRDRVDAIIDGWRAARPDLDVGALAVTNRLLRAGHLLQSKLDAIAAGFGLSHKGDLDVLTALARSDPPFQMTPSRLAELLLLTSGGMTIRLDRLENAGLIRRGANPSDRRGIVISLTTEGKALVDRAFAEVLEAQTSFARILGDDTATVVADALRTLLIDLGDVEAR